MTITHSPKFLQHPKVRFINGLQTGDVIKLVTTEGLETMVITDLKYGSVSVSVPDSYSRCQYSESSDWNEWEKSRTVFPVHSIIRTVTSIQAVRANHSIRWSFSKADGSRDVTEGFPYKYWYRNGVFNRVFPCPIEELSGALIDNIDLIRQWMGLSSIRSK
jgi:hypothetical protein